jgi:hypothetical protein
MNLILMAVTEQEARCELHRHFSLWRRQVLETSGAMNDALAPARNVGLFVVECCASEPGGRLGLIERFRYLNPRAHVIVIAVKSSEDLAIAAFRLGVRDYFRWPDHAHALNVCLDRYLPQLSAGPLPNGKLIGQSPQIRDVLGSIQRAATTESNVLITGETRPRRRLRHAQPMRARLDTGAISDCLCPLEVARNPRSEHHRGSGLGRSAQLRGAGQSRDRELLEAARQLLHSAGEYQTAANRRDGFAR